MFTLMMGEPTGEGQVLMFLHVSGWWFGTWLLWLSIQLGMSSSQLTNSYFSTFMTFHSVGNNHHILGISSSQLTKSIIFQGGRAQPPTSSTGWWMLIPRNSDWVEVVPWLDPGLKHVERLVKTTRIPCFFHVSHRSWTAAIGEFFRDGHQFSEFVYTWREPWDLPNKRYPVWRLCHTWVHT